MRPLKTLALTSLLLAGCSARSTTNTNDPNNAHAADPNAISATLSTLTATAPAGGVLVGGTEKSTLTAVVKSAAGTPLAGAQVAFSASGTSNQLSAAAPTDAQGTATLTLSSTAAEIKTITAQATYLGKTVQLAAQPTVAFVHAVVSIDVPTGVPADGNGVAAITVRVHRPGGAGVPAQVTLAASGTQNRLTPQAQATASDGTLSAQLVSTVAEAKTITATAKLADTTEVGTATLTLAASNACYATPLLSTVPWAATAPAPQAVALADMDGDGVLDLVSSNDASYAYGNSVGAPPFSLSVLLGRGDGTYGEHVDTAVSSSLATILALDVSGDGRPDVLGFAPGEQRIQRYLNNGTGGLQAPVDVPTQFVVGQILAVDLSEDGHADLVALSPNNQVAVLVGDGNGQFTTVAGDGNILDPNFHLIDAQPLDADHDGHLDLVVSWQAYDAYGGPLRWTPMGAWRRRCLCPSRQAAASRSRAMRWAT